MSSFSVSSYISARLPNGSITELPAFLCTEFINIETTEKAPLIMDTGASFHAARHPKVKKDTTPIIMKMADSLLTPLRVFTKFDDQKIGYEGIPSKKELPISNDIGPAFGGAGSIIMGLTHYVSDKAILLTIPFFTNAVSMTTPMVKHLSSIFATWIDDKTENTISRNAIKITTAAVLLIPIAYFAKTSFTLTAKIAHLSQSQLALGILGYLGTMFAAGASLKLYAYHNNPEVNHAYNHFLTNRV